MPPREVMPLAKAAALRAVELDDQLAEAHASLAGVRKNYDWTGRQRRESTAARWNSTRVTRPHIASMPTTFWRRAGQMKQ